MNQKAQLEIERNLEGRYKITETAPIGKGNYAKVYRGYMVNDPTQQVAIKRVKLYHLEGQIIKQLRSEVETMTGLGQHTNIVKLIETTEVAKTLYIVMELCKFDLKQFKKRFYPRGMPEILMLQCLGQITEGLEHLKDHNVIHRDIKSENILIQVPEEKYRKLLKGEIQVQSFTRQPFILKITDFGLSKKLKEQLGTTNTNAGTPYTMAPEVINEQPYTMKADLFSLGVLTMRMLLSRDEFQEFLSKERDPMAEPWLQHRLISNETQTMIISMLQPDQNLRDSLGSILKSFKVLKLSSKHAIQMLEAKQASSIYERKNTLSQKRSSSSLDLKSLSISGLTTRSLKKSDLEKQIQQQYGKLQKLLEMKRNLENRLEDRKTIEVLHQPKHNLVNESTNSRFEQSQQMRQVQLNQAPQGIDSEIQYLKGLRSVSKHAYLAHHLLMKLRNTDLFKLFIGRQKDLLSDIYYFKGMSMRMKMQIQRKLKYLLKKNKQVLQQQLQPFLNKVEEEARFVHYIYQESNDYFSPFPMWWRLLPKLDLKNNKQKRDIFLRVRNMIQQLVYVDSCGDNCLTEQEVQTVRKAIAHLLKIISQQSNVYFKIFTFYDKADLKALLSAFDIGLQLTGYEALIPRKPQSSEQNLF